jgi:Aspartyl protease
MPPYDDRLFVPPAPVARVVVRHPEREQSIGDVPMLIDSGAYATLLPKSAVSSLGLEGTGERYQFIGFEGTISESEAVLASLSFLRRNIRGVYLLTSVIERFMHCVSLPLLGATLDQRSFWLRFRRSAKAVRMALQTWRDAMQTVTLSAAALRLFRLHIERQGNVIVDDSNRAAYEELAGLG